MSLPDRNAAFRIFDAAANRAAEAARVVEDFARFALDDPLLLRLCKEVRHDLAAATAEIPPAARLAARETRADVGADVGTEAEYRRPDAAAVAAAAHKRLQQALRSLEEFGKTLSPETGRRFEALRYRAYTLERLCGIAGESRRRLANVRLCVLIDGRENDAVLAALAGDLARAGAAMLQLREKQLPDRVLLARAKAFCSAAREAGALAIVNDRPEIAALARADGVHLGQDDLPVKEARSILGPGPLIGVSTHSLAEARQAVFDGADYLGVGPVFPTPTKQFAAFPGLELLQAVGSETYLPAFAIGGIGLENLPQVLETPIRRVAVSSAVLGAADPAAAVRAICRLLEHTGEGSTQATASAPGDSARPPDESGAIPPPTPPGNDSS